MMQLHNQEKKQFKKLFKQEHIDDFEDRFKVLEVFLQAERHMTDKDLIQLLEEYGYKSDPDFVRDTLRMMCQFGFAQTNQFDNGVVWYEHRHLGQHHDHMICTKCRKIIEFKEDQLENLQVQVAAVHGFHMLQHKMEIYGICSECLKKREQLISLVTAKQGERLVIKEFIGGSASQMRLLSMGLRIGDEIEVVTNFNKGQLVIALDYNRLALGRGLAQKILVQPSNN
ncbi:transcriptional repressor [Desulfonema magnum]|uniref:Ferric uptake regulation protein n=1 Tax=Desulfonema magnum TaxID=45655 RepID=A0A975BJ13_9BACT|nr:transcriptional repressor [Desulfonema magnum]QTA86341.1 Ferric uptake regulator [Desulfonema magnum]